MTTMDVDASPEISPAVGARPFSNDNIQNNNVSTVSLTSNGGLETAAMDGQEDDNDQDNDDG